MSTKTFSTTPSLLHSESITAVSDFAETQLTEASPKVQDSPFSPTSSTGADVTASTASDSNTTITNAASADHGARILFATDEWFASADNLLKDSPPVFDPDAYCEQGKVMDGWESRRRREAGHDWCVIQLSSRTSVLAVELDTAHFTGNNAPAVSIEIADLDCTQEARMVVGFPGVLERLLRGCVRGTGASPPEVERAEKACRAVAKWKELLPKTPLRPGYEETRMHYFQVEPPLKGTHVRVNYYPDGGVARMRLWGHALKTPAPTLRPAYSPIQTGTICTVISHSQVDVPSRQPYDYPELSCETNGGIGLACSNKHYGDPWNLIQPTLGRDMGDGWETARHPDRPGVLVKDKTTNLVDSPLSDWCILKLGQAAGDGLQRIILDTKHFRGNYPESVAVEGCFTDSTEDAADLMVEEQGNGVEWFSLIPRCRMAPDSEHVFDEHQITNATRKVSHIRVSIFPDGGLSRVRVYGLPGDLQ